MPDDAVAGSEAVQVPYAQRRRQAKYVILEGLAAMADDMMAAEFFADACERLGIGEEAQQRIVDEVADELRRRADRLAP